MADDDLPGRVHRVVDLGPARLDELAPALVVYKDEKRDRSVKSCVVAAP